MGELALGGMLACGCADQVVGTYERESDAALETTAGLASSSGATVGDTSPPSTSEGTGASDGADEVGPHPVICDAFDTDGGPTDLECGDCTRIDSATHVYWVCADELDWVTANAMCGTVGATSAIITTSEQMEVLLEEIPYGFFFLGARKNAAGQWQWVDGTLLEYANWALHQPDDLEPGQDCLRMTLNIVDEEGWFHGAWDDFFCDFPQRVLCSARVDG